MKGPGHTRFVAKENGEITCIKWNDESWSSVFAWPYDTDRSTIAAMLRRAYIMGFNDRLHAQEQANRKVEI